MKLREFLKESESKLKRVAISPLIKIDLAKTLGHINSMNAKGAIGYAFNPNGKEDEIATGMYIHRLSELDPKKWTYYYEFKSKGIFEIPDDYISEDKGDEKTLQAMADKAEKDVNADWEPPSKKQLPLKEGDSIRKHYVDTIIGMFEDALKTEAKYSEDKKSISIDKIDAVIEKIKKFAKEHPISE